MQAVDFSRVRVLDLSQNFSVNSPPFAFYEGPTIKWVKKLAFEGVNAQLISSTNHIATHLDSPLHFHDPGPDVAGIPLPDLVGPACVVDLQQFGIGDYDIYGPEHFEQWEKKHKIKIERGNILVIHTGYHAYYNEDWSPATRERHPDAGPNLPRSFLKHPGPRAEFCQWILDRGIRWLAVDAISTDHPFNTAVRRARPDLILEVEAKIGMPLEEAFPWPRDYQATHTLLFPKGVYHVENVGGEIDKVLDKRVWIGAFPFRFKGGEAAFCRFVAFVQE
ncbi:MAG: putative polyketide cyclase [Armatimonadetes bacterium CSP1-3]|nr:MAG: putative polyketide cyclase [Armatimonadetes bacterium CSP1-3]